MVFPLLPSVSIPQIWISWRNPHVRLMKVWSPAGCSSGKFKLWKKRWEGGIYNKRTYITVTWLLVVMLALLPSVPLPGGSCSPKLVPIYPTGNWLTICPAWVVVMNSRVLTARSSVILMPWPWLCPSWSPLKCLTPWTGKILFLGTFINSFVKDVKNSLCA